MKTFKQFINEALTKVEIIKKSSGEDNVSNRFISYDIHINGKYETTFKDVNDALDFKSEIAKRDIAEIFKIINKQLLYNRGSKIERTDIVNDILNKEKITDTKIRKYFINKFIK